ncbi:MAG: hypothetical protein HQL70_01325 [Magnetococcales bacterium]|nr:hypothetical protein [Magnetococcales bacterium]
MAGIVEYQSGSPNQVMFEQSWSILKQLAAFFLAIGFNEAQVSVFFSCLILALFFQGFASIVLALTRNIPLALLTAILFLESFAYFGYSDFSVIPNGMYVYSQVALALGALIFGLVGLGRVGLAAFLLGLTPATHILWGAWYLGVWGCTLLFARFSKWPLDKIYHSYKFLLLGLSITASSFLLHIYLYGSAIPSAATVDADYLAALKVLWQYTHTKFDLSAKHWVSISHTLLFIPVVVVSIFLVKKNSRDMEPLMLMALVLSALFGAVAFFVYKLGGWVLPDLFLRTIPNRFITLPIALSGLTLIAILFNSGRGVTQAALIFILAFAAFEPTRVLLDFDLLLSVIAAGWLAFDYEARQASLLINTEQRIVEPAQKLLLGFTPILVFFVVYGLRFLFYKDPHQLLVFIAIGTATTIFLWSTFQQSRCANSKAKYKIINFLAGYLVVNLVGSLVLVREFRRHPLGVMLILGLVIALVLYRRSVSSKISFKIKKTVPTRPWLLVAWTIVPATSFLVVYILWRTWPLDLLFIGVCGISVLPIILSIDLDNGEKPSDVNPKYRSYSASLLLTGFLIITLSSAGGLIHKSYIHMQNSSPYGHPLLQPDEDINFWKKAEDLPGVLLTAASISRMSQIWSRKPTLIYAATLNGWVVYLPDEMPKIQKMLKDVYGLELFNKKDSCYLFDPTHKCEDNRGFAREVWENRDIVTWQKISKKYNVYGIVTPPNWELDLPLVARSAWHALYRIK